MRNQEELMALINFAKSQGMPSIEVDGVKFYIGQTPQKIETPVPESEPHEIITPLSVLDDLDDDEITYWATPYYDEIQAKKEAQRNSKKESEIK